MFQVGKVLISDDVALAEFECDLAVCKGACCVIGDAGAPVTASELPILNRAFDHLKSTLPAESVQTVNDSGLFDRAKDGYELRCTSGGACVFVVEERGVSLCAIQRAFFKGEFEWEKPVSCHLFPIRITSMEGMDFMNFQYIPSLCSGGKACGRRNKKGLAEFLEKPLIRRYGKNWYASFMQACVIQRSLNLPAS